MTKKIPYLPLFVQDFLTDEKLINCSAAATGVYIKLMCLLHKQDVRGSLIANNTDIKEASSLFKEYTQNKQQALESGLYLEYEANNFLSEDEKYLLEHLSQNLSQNLSYMEQTARQRLEQIPKQIDKANFLLCFVSVCLTKQMNFKTNIIQESLVELVQQKVIYLGTYFVCQKRMYQDFLAKQKNKSLSRFLSQGEANLDSQKGFIYWISDGATKHKIGTSKEPKARLYRIRTDERNSDLEIIKTIAVDNLEDAEQKCLAFFTHVNSKKLFDLSWEEAETKFALLFASLKTNAETNTRQNTETKHETSVVVSVIENENINTNKTDNSITNNLEEANEKKTNQLIAEVVTAQKKQFPKFDDAEFERLPDAYLTSIPERYFLTKRQNITPNQLKRFWQVFKTENLTGDKFYATPNEVFKHFSNWVCTQKIIAETNSNAPAPNQRKKVDVSKYEKGG